jgi:hypothetical protein
LLPEALKLNTVDVVPVDGVTVKLATGGVLKNVPLSPAIGICQSSNV